jgi:serine/threonine protein phosphatase PrpC
MPSRLRLEVAGATHPGLIRARNEDAFLAVAEAGVVAVADGVATRLDGATASRTVLEIIARALIEPWRGRPAGVAGSPAGVRAQFLLAVHEANERLYLDSRDVPRDQRMATTFAGALLADDLLHIAHVGDSRVHLCRAGSLRALTTDHTRANELIARGVSEEGACSVPDAGALTRALGVSKTVLVSAHSEPVRLGDLILASTDGLHQVVSGVEIAAILHSAADLNAVAGALIERALLYGGRDNVTAVVARVVAAPPELNDESPEPPTPSTLRQRT